MTSQTPIGGDSKDPFEKYRVDELRKTTDSHEKEEKTSQPATPAYRSSLATYLGLVFNKFVDLFEKTSSRGLSSSAERALRQHLLLFKEALEKLQKNDQSKDISFLDQLSQLWHQVLEDMARFRSQTEFSSRLRSLIYDMKNYPEQPPHSFGYYLSEYAGQKWLPLPYLELVQKLHIQYSHNPAHSILSQWVLELEQLTDLLR